MRDRAGLGTVGGRRSAAGPSRQAGAPAQPAAVDLKLPNKKGTVKFAVIGDNGTGEKEQYEVGAEMAKWQTALPVRLRDHARRQHVRQPEPPRLRQEVRGPVQGAARARRQVLRGARQPRQPGEPLLQAVEHERRALLHATRRTASASSCSTPTTWISRSASGSSASCRSRPTTGRSPTSTIRSTPRRRRTDRRPTFS